MSENNFLQMKKGSKTEAWIFYGCCCIEEAKAFADEEDGEVLELSDEEVAKRGIKLDFGK